MSAYYDVYAEIRVKDTWHALGPFVQNQDGAFEFTSLFWGQSIFREVDNDLRNHVLAWGLPENASEELLSKFHDLDEETDWWGKPITYREYYNNYVYTVDFDKAVAPKVMRSRPFKYHGYVSKHTIAAFECGEIEEIDYWYTQEEYDALEQGEQREYAHYEWNNRFDEYGVYCEIKQKVEILREWFLDEKRHSDSGFTWTDLEYTPIRLIVYGG